MSPRRPRRSEYWAKCWRRRRTPTAERGCCRRWRARSRRRAFAGSRRCSTTQPIAEAFSSAAATWPTSSAFLRRARPRAGSDVRSKGVDGTRLRAYGSKETHTWIQKAADIAGLGTDSVRWIAVDNRMRIDLDALRTQIRADLAAGDKPFMVIGNAGTVSTGAVDSAARTRRDLPRI